MDDSSGVGVLLELARVWSAEQPRRTLVFLLTDGGEWGSLGARDFAASYPERARTIAALSLDFVAAGELAADLQRFLDDKPILAKRPTSEIKKAAREEGMRFLRESAVERVMKSCPSASWRPRT